MHTPEDLGNDRCKGEQMTTATSLSIKAQSPLWVLEGYLRTYPRNLAAWRREISLDVARVSLIGPPR